MFAIGFGLVGFLFWLRYLWRHQKVKIGTMAEDPSTPRTAIFGVLFNIRYSGFAMILGPLIVGALLDELLGTTIRKVFG